MNRPNKRLKPNLNPKVSTNTNTNKSSDNNVTKEAAIIRSNTRREIKVLQSLHSSTSNMTNKITPVFLVEEHSEALLCLQRSMRRQVLPMKNIKIIHYDAHPDLSIPQKLTPDLVYRPNELLDILRNTESGIAEWMMPLVYAGHVNHIVWVRSKWSKQLLNGNYHINVGESIIDHTEPSQKYLAVDCNAPYFANDGMTCNLSNLEHSKQLSLDVVTSNTNPIECILSKMSGNTSSNTINNNLVLDICLDYFSTNNPFLEALKNSTISKHVIHTIIHVCNEFSRKLQQLQWNQQTWNERLRRAMLEEFIKKKIYKLKKIDMTKHSTVKILVPHLFSEHLFDQFVNALLLFEKDEEEQQQIKKKQEGTAMHISSTSSPTTNSPTTNIDLIFEYCMWSELPSHQSTRSEMLTELNVLKNTLLKWKNMNIQPNVVTIACSSEDGFINNEDVKWLINEILNILNITFHGHLDLIPERQVEDLYGIKMGKYVPSNR
jgi:hypothetical protein